MYALMKIWTILEWLKYERRFLIMVEWKQNKAIDCHRQNTGCGVGIPVETYLRVDKHINSFLRQIQKVCETQDLFETQGKICQKWGK